jgi:ubiquitin thioesterase protein OTUB1
MRASDRPLAVVCARSALEPTLAMLAHAGFEKIAYEDPYQQFLSLIDKVLGTESDGSALTPKSLLESFQNSEGEFYSRNLLRALRMITR